ncbi:hypothetical protein EV175_007668, partial [Coemansia sp. RSA 1933]
MSTKSGNNVKSALDGDELVTDESGFVRSYYGEGGQAIGDLAGRMLMHEQRRRLPAFKHRMQFLYA